MVIVAKTKDEGFDFPIQSMTGTTEKLAPYVVILNLRNNGLVYSIASKQPIKSTIPSGFEENALKPINKNDIFVSGTSRCATC
jgi:hypothetical protein